MQQGTGARPTTRSQAAAPASRSRRHFAEQPCYKQQYSGPPGGVFAAQNAYKHNAALGTIMTLAWMGFSTALIVANKHIYQMGFMHPFFVTGMGQVFSALGGLVLVKMKIATLRPNPSLHIWTSRLLPVIISTSATMFYGNASYLTLSVAFIQILKAFTPALTLVLCLAAGLEKPSWPLALSVLLIAAGTASSVLIESGTPAFDMWGFLNFLASSVTEAARVVGAELLLGSARYNSAEALWYIGGPTAVVLLLSSAVWEGQTIWHKTGRLLVEHPVTFSTAFLLSFLVNLSCFFAIRYTSSLTFKVAGCLKNLAVVWYGVAAHNETVTANQMVGYLLSLVGFASYSYIKSHHGPAHFTHSSAIRAGGRATVVGQTSKLKAT